LLVIVTTVLRYRAACDHVRLSCVIKGFTYLLTYLMYDVMWQFTF